MWKQPNCPSADEWTNKRWSIHTMKYYSSLKRNEIHTIWAHYENLVPREMSQIQNTNIIWLHLFAVPRRVKFIDKGKMVEAEGGRNRVLLFNGYRVSVCDDGNFLEMDIANGCHWIVHSKLINYEFYVMYI